MTCRKHLDDQNCSVQIKSLSYEVVFILLTEAEFSSLWGKVRQIAADSQWQSEWTLPVWTQQLDRAPSCPAVKWLQQYPHLLTNTHTYIRAC